MLNDAGKLVGIITSSDVVELVDDEMGDDYAKLGGLTGEEDLNENVFESVKKRTPVADRAAVPRDAGLLGRRRV